MRPCSAEGESVGGGGGGDVGAARAEGGEMQGIKPDTARRECVPHTTYASWEHRKGLLVGGARGLQTPTSGEKKRLRPGT